MSGDSVGLTGAGKLAPYFCEDFMAISTVLYEGAFTADTRNTINDNFTFLNASNIFSVNSNSTATGTTLTAAQLLGTGYMSRTGTSAAFTDTTDTAANIIPILTTLGASVGSGGINNILMNNTAYNMTLSGGTGVTISGGSILPPYSSALYIASITSVTTVTLRFITINNNLGALPSVQYAAATNTTAFTATGAQVAGAGEVVLNLTGALAAGANITLPTAANIIAGIPNAQTGNRYILRIINSSSGAFAWTVVTNTGLTLTGTMTIAQNTWREFVVTITSGSAVSVQAIGTGTQS